MCKDRSWVYNVGMLTEDEVRRILPIGAFGAILDFSPSLGSTNVRAIELARQGAPHGLLVVADEQTAGRGREGRRWITAAGKALAFSVLLRPQGIPADRLGTVSGLGGVSVAQALEELGGTPQLKWPNDVLLKGRKVAGVLTEAAWEGARLDSVILGVGVNVLRGSAPPDSEVDFPATSAEESLGRPVDRIQLLAPILHHLDRWCQEFGSATLLAAWEHYLCYRDEPVLVVGGRQPIRGILRGLGRTGSLLLEVAGRGMVEVRPDRVQLRPIDSLEESATLEGGEGPDVR